MLQTYFKVIEGIISEAEAVFQDLFFEIDSFNS